MAPAALTETIQDPHPPGLVAAPPKHCPGVESEAAGKDSACNGCANQAICASSAPKGPDPDVPLITARLAGISHKIMVVSGKGGVGKSTFTAMLARAFATDEDTSVGILDTDITGPSIPLILGVQDHNIHVSASWDPVWAADNIGVISVQFMLPNTDDAIIFRGNKKSGLIKQFLTTVDWGGDLDFLLIDTPPGTSDEHLSVNSYLKESGIDGAIVLTTPQEVSLLDARKELDYLKKANIPILGIIENMSGFVCKNCKTENHVFRATTGGARQLAVEKDIRFLGAVPLDPLLGMACDYGEDPFAHFSESPVCKIMKSIAGNLKKILSPRSTC